VSNIFVYSRTLVINRIQDLTKLYLNYEIIKYTGFCTSIEQLQNYDHYSIYIRIYSYILLIKNISQEHNHNFLS